MAFADFAFKVHLDETMQLGTAGCYGEPHRMNFLTKPWPSITSALKNAKHRVAVTPYLNGDAFSLLPLRQAKDMLVVDASEANVKLGLTNPHEIEKFLEHGVRCYSVASLHAKVYRADKSLFVGSANASSHSRDTLNEACLEVKNSAVIEQFEQWLAALSQVPLTRERLSALKKIYHAPKWPNKSSIRNRTQANSWITSVDRSDESEESILYRESVASQYEMNEDDIFTITLPKGSRFENMCTNAKAGDEVFVIDLMVSKKVVHQPLRLIEPPRLIKGHYRFALEDSELNAVSLGRFVQVARRTYAAFPTNGRAQRQITQVAAARLRKLWS